jgi:hypothetical protein
VVLIVICCPLILVTSNVQLPPHIPFLHSTISFDTHTRGHFKGKFRLPFLPLSGFHHNAMPTVHNVMSRLPTEISGLDVEHITEG